jgi:hypothetical protein
MENKQVHVHFSYVDDNEQKCKYVKDIYGDRLNDAEVNSSMVWVAVDDNDKARFLALGVKQNIFKDVSTDHVHITHASMPFGDPWFYLCVEKQCVEQGIDYIYFSFPQNIVEDKAVISFMKNLEFKQYGLGIDVSVDGCFIEFYKDDLKSRWTQDKEGKWHYMYCQGGVNHAPNHNNHPL